jgi:hypothetical protein
MSTPATYEIDGFVFYCHYDGHPIGAAQRLCRMIEAHTRPADQWPHQRGIVADMRGGLAFAFIRANNDAEQPAGGTRARATGAFHYKLSWEVDDRLFITIEQRTDRQTWRILDHEEFAAWTLRQRADLIDRLSAAAGPGRELAVAPADRAAEIIPDIVYAHTKGRFGEPSVRYATRSTAQRLVELCGRRIADASQQSLKDPDRAVWVAALARDPTSTGWIPSRPQ